MTDDEIKAIRTIYDRGYTVTAANDIPALLDEIARLRVEADTMRNRIAVLREALEDVREWSKDDHVMRFDDGDVALADYCTDALNGGK